MAVLLYVHNEDRVESSTRAILERAGDAKVVIAPEGAHLVTRNSIKEGVTKSSWRTSCATT